jgi:hypothetical protein
VLFHFEYRCQGRWEAIGSGEGGEGEQPSLAALEDLIGLAGGVLPFGRYRCIAATSAATRWDALELGPGGEISFAEGPPPAAGEPAAGRRGRGR